MTKIQNPKQKNNHFEPVWNLEFMILKKSVNGYAKGKGKNMKFKFCPFCGRRLQEKSNRRSSGCFIKK